MAKRSKKSVRCICGEEVVISTSQHVLVTATSYACEGCDRLIQIQTREPALALELAAEAWRRLQEQDGFNTAGAGPILFYGAHREYGEFSNFYPVPIRIGGKTYPSAEHYFQACKACSRKEHEAIRLTPTPGEAKRKGRGVALRTDWEEAKMGVMHSALRAKFSQHDDLKALLLSSGDRVIHEDSPSDKIWGWMGGQGQDLLGKLLMELRTELREEEEEEESDV